MSFVACKTSYLTHCTFNSCTRHQKLLSHGKRGHLHSGFPTLFFILLRGRTPLELIGGCPILKFDLPYKHSGHVLLFPLLRTLVPQHTVTTSSSFSYSHPVNNILSAHAHGRGLGATQKVRYH